jgi:esterase/lipase superfamily enzyme
MKRAARQVGVLPGSEVAGALSELETHVEEQSRDEMTGMRRYQGAESEIKPREVADFQLVSVHYGTHRNRTECRNPYDFYGAERAELSYGKAIVSVPKNREVGTITRAPGRAESRYDEYRFDPGRHFIIKTVAVIDSRKLFLEDLTEAIDVSVRREVLVFVHGYNASFADALIRAAQLAVDLEIDGATVAYSWPSRASLLSYVVDRNQVIGPFLDDLKNLISSVATATGATRVHLIAHSMGGKFLLEALEALASDHDKPLTDEIIFASPDVDVDDFNYGINKIRHLAPRITVYSSSNDRALRLSERINGGVRAGASAERVAASGADAIDTTSVAQGFIAHTDFARTALDDVRAVVWIEKDVDPHRRDAILRPDQGQWGRFWRFIPEEPRTEDGPFREALIWARRVGLQKAKETAANMIAVIAPSAARAAERVRLEKLALELEKLTN